MIGLRPILLLFAVLLFAFVATASPVTPNEGGLVKKALKQYKARRGETPTRRDPATASYAVNKRAAPPTPSQPYRK